MFEYFVNYIFIFSTTFYLYFHLLNIDKESIRRKKILCTILLSVIAMLLRTYFSFYSILVYPIFYLILLLCFHSEPKLGFVTSLIAFSLSNVLLILSILIYSTLLFPFFHNLSVPPNIVSLLISGILMYFVAHLPFRIQRFRNGMRFLYYQNLINVGTGIGIATIAILIIGQHLYSSAPYSQMFSYYILILLAAILLFFLWQRCIRQYYLTKLRHLELESLRQELAEKDAVIEKLQANNELQARMIHKDNKLIPAMLSAVTEYLSMVDSNDRTMQEHGTMLAGQLKELADERLTVLTAASEAAASLPLLHRASVDAMLSYMQKRAMQENILFEVKIHPDFEQKIEISITEPDLTHLLSDLLENAIIATKTAADRHIFVHLGILYDAAVVEVSDSGQAFEPSVYQDFGLQKHSTHLDNGGSGIGLMDIWELKKKYAASLHIYEYTGEAAPFTKKISIVFDRKKHYLIRTFRPEELVKMQARSDLYILPLNDGKD